MSYATQQHMIDRFGLDALLIVADPTNSGTIDVAQMATALKDANAEVDLYVGSRYDLPLPSPLPDRTTNLLERLACDLANQYLSKDSLGDSEAKQKAHDDALKTLALIAKGTVKLAIDTFDEDDDGDADSVSDAVDITSSERLFSRKTMRHL